VHLYEGGGVELRQGLELGIAIFVLDCDMRRIVDQPMNEIGYRGKTRFPR